MFYERKVKYLDYLIGQEKQGNAGFVKLEVRDCSCNIQINFCNLRGENMTLPVYAVADGKEKKLCVVELSEGKGAAQLLHQNRENICGTGIAYSQLKAVKVPISAERIIYGEIHESVKVTVKGEIKTDVEPEEYAAEIVKAEPECEENTVEEISQENGDKKGEEEKEMQDTDAEKKARNGAERRESQKAETERIEKGGVEKERIGEVIGIEAKETETKVLTMCEDKWNQLWQIYPHIAPFRDQREFLSLAPADFVILPKKYYGMANNSFLLHGFYNYKHLILKKTEFHGEDRYYIGVPGNFYDREKQVAIMFGFESFESKQEYADAGDYGYYLMRIEL